MTCQFLQSKRPPVRIAGWKTEISAVVAAMGIAVAVVPPIATGDGAVAGLTRVATASFSRLSAIPSHNGGYRASLAPSPDHARGFDAREWTVEVRTAAGAPVKDATLALEGWMPDDDRVPATRPRVTRYLGDGRYLIEGLRLDRPGWWNVKLQVAQPGNRDSLAFNLVR